MRQLSLDELAPLTLKQQEARKILAEPDLNHILLAGGSRSGKTVMLCRTLVLRCLISPGSTHVIFREHFNHIKASIIDQTMPEVLRLWFPYLKTKMNRSDWVLNIFLGNKTSKIYFGGLDDKIRTEKILGQEHSTIYLNECSTISFQAYNLALTRLAQKSNLKLKMFFDCNPPLQSHWIYKLFVKKVSPVTNEPLRRPEKYKMLIMNPKDNMENLPADYMENLKDLPKAQQDRFLHGLFGSSVPNALWPEKIIKHVPRPESEKEWTLLKSRLKRIVIAVDPSGCGQDVECLNDQIGIVVVGLREDGKALVLQDETGYYSPANWGKLVARLWDKWGADAILWEANFGGHLVEENISNHDRNMKLKKVTVTRGKHLRAEPQAAQYEKDKVLHVGRFVDMETEMSQFSTAGYLGENSPNRVDCLVMALKELLGTKKYSDIGVF